jgi:hypothetical protein
MTVTHLFFAAITTAYILFAIRLEERDLIAAHPEYAAYRARTPMLIPGTRALARRTTARGASLQPAAADAETRTAHDPQARDVIRSLTLSTPPLPRHSFSRTE